MFWVSALRQYSPGEVLNIFIYRLRGEPPNLKHSSFTALTTGVSNPFRSQRLRPSTSVFTWNDAFAFGGPTSINRFHPYSCNSSVPLLDSSKSVQYSQDEMSIESMHSTGELLFVLLNLPFYGPFRPI
jgi:hypothetical protein